MIRFTSEKPGRSAGDVRMHMRRTDSRPEGMARPGGSRGREWRNVTAAMTCAQGMPANMRCPAAISHSSTPNAYTSAACMPPRDLSICCLTRP